MHFFVCLIPCGQGRLLVSARSLCDYFLQASWLCFQCVTPLCANLSGKKHHKLDPQSWFCIIPEESRGCILRRELHAFSSILGWKWVCDNRENVHLGVRRDREMGVSSSLLVSLLCTYALWVLVIQISSHLWPLKLSAGSWEMLIIQQKRKRSFPTANSKIYFPKLF